jgi:multiple sugar transport system substrate-binding protein
MMRRCSKKYRSRTLVGRRSRTPARAPYYSDMSLEMAEQFNASLNGDVPVEQALSELQTELQNIVNQG